MPTQPKPHSSYSSHPYPFGLMMPGRSWSEGYRFGFNGQEQDDEVYGDGILNTALYWEYDTRLGKRWNMDPVVIPGRSPYLAFDDNPIFFTDIYGDSEDGPGGRRAMKRAVRKIDKLERKGYNGWIADQVDNDGRLDIAFTGKDESGDYFVGGATEKLNIIDRISNGFSSGDAWVHSDDGEQFGQGVADLLPSVAAGHILIGLGEGVDMYGNQMEGIDYLSHGLSIVPSNVAGESVSIILRAAKPSIKFVDSKELAKRLNSTERHYHKVIKPKMKKRFANEMKELGTSNPDFTPDSSGNIILRNPDTGMTKSTNIPLTEFRKND